MNWLKIEIHAFGIDIEVTDGLALITVCEFASLWTLAAVSVVRMFLGAP